MSAARIWRRRAVALALIATALLALYFLWFRDSSLVSVDEVKVEGASANGEQIAAALEDAAGEMTTLNVDEQRLAEAVARFPTVASIQTDASLPHTLTITITERLPVGVLKVAGEPVAVASDGVLLRGLDARGAKLTPLEPEGELQAGGTTLSDEGIAQATVLGAAPGELRERVERVLWDAERGGVVVALEASPELRFGDEADAEDKWRAAVAVLASHDLGSPGYVDVSVPGRAATGGG